MSNNIKLYFPPAFRFIMEVTAWSWFIILGLTVDLIFIIGFVVSVSMLAFLNFPGDKAKEGPVNIPGWLRISNEWIFGGLFSLIGAWLLFKEIGLLIQIAIVLITIFLDRERYYWFLGLKEEAPDYVKIITQNKK